MSLFVPQKAHPCVISRLLSHHASKSVEGSDLWVVPRKKGICMYVCMYVCKNNLTLYFTHLPRSPPSKDLHQNWKTGRFANVINCQFFGNQLRGLDSEGGDITGTCIAGL